MIVHHLNNSRSQRILWMLEELELDYQIQHYQRDTKTMLAPQALKDVHPLGKSPVLTDNGHTIAESGAIVEYLADKCPEQQFRPLAGTDTMLQYRYWLHFAEGSMMPFLVLKLVMQRIEDGVNLFFLKPLVKAIVNQINSSYINPNITQQLAYINTHLTLNEWFAGEQLSGADIQMSFPLEAAVHSGACEPYPAIIEWVKRIQARDAYQVALAKGGEYRFG